MDSHPQNNAMTEIALALAMGFFSIMVISMVSLGAANDPAPDAEKLETTAAALAPAATEADTRGNRSVRAQDAFFVYYDGRFYDRDLDPVAKSDRQIAADRRAVLALPPSLSVKDAMAARDKIAAENLIVAPLSKDWMNQLEEIEP